MYFLSLTTVAALLSSITFAVSTHSPLINTTIGTIRGFQDSGTPGVFQFLGVPFAIPPTGNYRWLPPAPYPRNLSTPSVPLSATSIGPACPQQAHDGTDVFSPNAGNQTEFFSPPNSTFSEDCLTLNIWAPARHLSNDTTKLPVLVWFFGGGFIEGGTNALYFDPQNWIQRTQAHIVVTVNFRSNIFGFPNAAGLNDSNLGLLDQRLALEWVRANIANFGGDASKIVAWGQSGGAIAIDYLNFAYADDPIFSGMILSSGTAFFPGSTAQSNDTTHSHFATIAMALGCGGGTAEAQLDCLRSVPFQDVLDAVKDTNLTMGFKPVVDERLVFSDYTKQYAQGLFSTAPAIIGTTQHELNAVDPHVAGVPFNDTLVDKLANATFLCTAAKSTRLRSAMGRTTFRFRYDGVFPDMVSPAFPGAYHAAELPLIFGTAGIYHGPMTVYERTVGRVMQDLWVDFVKDPEYGLQNSGVWSTYENGKAILIGDIVEPVVEIDSQQLDSTCVTN